MSDTKKGLIIILGLKEMKEQHPEMTFGEILYSILNKNNLPKKPDTINTAWLLDITDKDYLEAVESAINFEKN